MASTAIEIRGLRKVYTGLRSGDTVALESLDLDVPTGGVFGFLGPNGAGKTTTIRCLLGLVRPTKGSVRILGADPLDDPSQVMDRIGALVESPKFFPGFSGRRNLELAAAVRGYGPDRVNEVLDDVGLASRADDRFGSYSLGMKQRLAVAGAMLKKPEVLILDEPANGLDPAGIKDMRDLIRQYGSSGSTVLVSSHQLAEVQLMCDSVAIVNRGRLIASGRVDDVLSSRGGTLIVSIEDREGAIRVLADQGFTAQPGDEPDSIIVDAGHDRASEVTRVLATDGRYLRGLRVETANLESVFLDLTSDHGGEA